MDHRPGGTRRLEGRTLSWGAPEDRHALHRLAEDIRDRSGFQVCAIEVRRHDEMLEFAAIVGSDVGAAALLGRASPPSAMEPALKAGMTVGRVRFVPRESMDAALLESMHEYGWTPDIAERDDPDQWYAEDMLVVPLAADGGEPRGLLYLDEPHSGKRPSRTELLALSERIELGLDAVITVIEREAMAHQVRATRAAREMLRSRSTEGDLAALIDMAHQHLRAGLGADTLAIWVFGEPDPEAVPDDLSLAPRLQAPLAAAVRRAWASQQVVVVEPDAVWGDDDLGERDRVRLRAHVAEHGLGALVAVPVGAGGQPLGCLLIARHGRWMDSEDAAALDVGHDLGQAIRLARTFDREQRFNEELTRLDAYRTELIATISHELKNPVGVIAGHLEILSGLADLPDAAYRSLTLMQRGADRVTALAESLLELSRLDQSSEPPAKDRVALESVASEVVDFNGVLAAQHEVQIHTALSGTSEVLGEAEELHQCLANLVGNAVKYSKPGGAVSVAVTHEGDEVVFSCADQGLGISADDQDRLFSEFFRSSNEEARSRPGTGLGLTIAHRIVTRHGGRIDVESELDVGTTFRVRLPAAP